MSFCPRGGGRGAHGRGDLHGRERVWQGGHGGMRGSGHTWQRGHAWQGDMRGRGPCIAGDSVRGEGGEGWRRDGHWSGRYASYWNAFLFNIFSEEALIPTQDLHHVKPPALLTATMSSRTLFRIEQPQTMRNTWGWMIWQDKYETQLIKKGCYLLMKFYV